MSMITQIVEVSDVTVPLPLYPILSTNLVLGTTTLLGPHLSLPYQDSMQDYQHDPNSLIPLLCGEIVHLLPSHAHVPHAGGEACAPQSEKMMVLKDINPTNVPSAVSTSDGYHSMPAKCSQETSCPGEYKQPGGKETDEYSKGQTDLG